MKECNWLVFVVLAALGFSGCQSNAVFKWTPNPGYLNIPLDKADPVVFYGDTVGYRDEYIPLGPKTFYIDGTLSDEIAAQYPYVYNSFIKAADDFTAGTADAPMRVLIAPYVYWCDPHYNPAYPFDDTANSDNGKTANTDWSGIYGMTIEIAGLSLEGLTHNPANVVLCGNRGQYNGSNGNWTLFNIIGDDLHISYLTLANYCSVDLVYPLKRELNTKKRTSGNPQAQLVTYSGDRAVARHTNFVSRLNLKSINGGKRTFYESCHFESTDDSLNEGVAIYLNCDFDFYGQMPAGDFRGGVFLNCDFRTHGATAEQYQFISKGTEPYGAIIDGRFVTAEGNISKLGWAKNLPSTVRCYQYNVTLNKKPVLMNAETPGVSVRLEDYPDLLRAYKVTVNGKSVYNTYNLLRGDDDWDPMNVKGIIPADAANLPTRMTAAASFAGLETGTGQTATTSFTIARTTGADSLNNAAIVAAGNLSWASLDGTLRVSPAGVNQATLAPANTTYADKAVIVEAVSELGLHAAVLVTSKPAQMAAPAFSANPSISLNSSAGTATVNYTLNLPNAALVDQSVINWYRCDTAAGGNPVQVAVTRLDSPEKTYILRPGDIGKYLKAEVAPKHNVSPAGAFLSAPATSVSAGDVKNANVYTTDFQNFPVAAQPNILPGYWTVDGYRPANGTQPKGEFAAGAATNASEGQKDSSLPPYDTTNDSWAAEAGSTTYNANGYFGLQQTARGARLMYTPLAGSYGDMSLTLVVAPEKNAGQGFGGAGQYMDVGIKFDTKTLTGYALRIERISTFGNAVVVNLVQYDNGKITKLTNTGGLALGAASKGVSCYITDCTIEVKVAGNKLIATVRSSSDPLPEHLSAGYAHTVDLEATITPNTFGGIHIQHTGTPGNGGGNRTLLHSLTAKWQ